MLLIFHHGNVPQQLAETGKCHSKQEAVSLKNTFDHIENDALKFCAGLFSLAQQELPEDQSLIWEYVAARVRMVLHHANAQKICQTALNQQVTPKVADEELLGLKEGVQDPEPGNETRAYQILNGASQPRHAWEHLLKRACADECQNLLVEMLASKSRISQSAVDLKGFSVKKLCAEKVVQKAEAEVLTCCGQECGWDNQTRRLWPFFDAAEKEDWNARCCAEGTILKNSSRERLCNSVQPKAKRQELYEMDPKQGTSRDALLVGQDLATPKPKRLTRQRSRRSLKPKGSRKKRSRRSLLQSEPGHVLCDMNFSSKCGNREEFLNACKEHGGENWQFLPSSDYQFLVKLSGVQRFSEKETSIRSCYAKLKEDVIRCRFLVQQGVPLCQGGIQQRS